MPKTKTSSILIYQVIDAMRHREYTVELLAGVTKYSTRQLIEWLYDDTAPYPPLEVIEQIMAVLRMLPVYVPAEEKETSIRDVLGEIEMAVFDSAPDSPPEVLRYQIRDLALQRYRLEEGYENGTIADKVYHTLLLKLADATRLTAEALTKVEAQAKQMIDGTAQVEIVYKEDDPPPKASKPLEEADFEPEELLPELPPIRKDVDV